MHGCVRLYFATTKHNRYNTLPYLYNRNDQLNDSTNESIKSTAIIPPVSVQQTMRNTLNCIIANSSTA